MGVLVMLWSPPRGASASDARTLRHVKRLTWCALVACGALAASLLGGLGRTGVCAQAASLLAVGIILVACVAILAQVAIHIRQAEAQRRAQAEAARLESARQLASAMHERIANKLSVTVGYAEFLVSDPRLPPDLREQAQKAMDGARAAAETMSELKRLTRQEHERWLADGRRPPGASAA